MEFEVNGRNYDIELEEVLSTTLSQNKHLDNYKDGMKVQWKIHKIEKESTYYKISAFKIVDVIDLHIVEDDYYGVFDIRYRDAAIIRVSETEFLEAIKREELEISLEQAEVIATQMINYKYKELFRYNYNELRKYIEVPLPYEKDNCVKLVVKVL